MKNRGAFIPNGTRDSLRRLYAFVAPNGKLDAVIDAQSLSDAWIIATGWGDQTDISERVEGGWRMYPCVVEWEAE
jgi:hypothetical protein